MGRHVGEKTLVIACVHLFCARGSSAGRHQHQTMPQGVRLCKRSRPGPCPQCSFCEDFAAAHSSESKVQKSGEGHCYSLFVSGSVVTFIIGAHRQMALLVVLHNYYLRSAKEPRAVLIVLYQHMRGVRFLAQTTEVVFGRGCEVREPRKLSSSIGL